MLAPQSWSRKRPGAVCARVMYNYFYCKKCIRKFNMAINNLKIGCFDVKVSGCVGTGHHTVIEALCTIYIGKTDQFRFLGNCPPTPPLS